MKKIYSAVLLLFSLSFLISCNKKETQNQFEKELKGTWNCKMEYYDSQDSLFYTDENIILTFDEDNKFVCKFDVDPILNTKGTWKVKDDQVYLFFYLNWNELNGLYQLTKINDNSFQLKGVLPIRGSGINLKIQLSK